MKEQMQKTNFYERLADLFEYPAADWKVATYADLDPSDSFTSFLNGVDHISLSELQELYTRTFDLNPVCALEIGYHLFGENYKRGEFLANLRQTEAPFDLGQDRQLPDYLPVLLRLIAKLQDEELRSALITKCLVPALEKMIKAVNGGENPYRYLLEVVHIRLRSELAFRSIETPAPPKPKRASLPIFQAGAMA